MRSRIVANCSFIFTRRSTSRSLEDLSLLTPLLLPLPPDDDEEEDEGAARAARPKSDSAAYPLGATEEAAAAAELAAATAAAVAAAAAAPRRRVAGGRVDITELDVEPEASSSLPCSGEKDAMDADDESGDVPWGKAKCSDCGREATSMVWFGTRTRAGE
jgi:hypothetical protein